VCRHPAGLTPKSSGRVVPSGPLQGVVVGMVLAGLTSPPWDSILGSASVIIGCLASLVAMLDAIVRPREQ